MEIWEESSCDDEGAGFGLHESRSSCGDDSAIGSGVIRAGAAAGITGAADDAAATVGAADGVAGPGRGAAGGLAHPALNLLRPPLWGEEWVNLRRQLRDVLADHL